MKEEMEKQSWPNSRLEVRLSETKNSSILLSIDNEGGGGGVRVLPGLTVPLPGSLTTLEISSQSTPSAHNPGYNFPRARRQQMSHI